MNLDEKIYKAKYLKYKAKYLKLRGGSIFGSMQKLLDPTKIIKEERDLVCNTPEYVFDTCNEQLKDFKIDPKLNKDERKATFLKIKEEMLNGKIQRIKYPNGIIYIGSLTKGVPHNKGKLKLTNGDTYKGDLKNLIPHGQGVMSNAADKITYEGTFIDGLPKGKKSLILSEKDKKETVVNNYYGEVLNEKPHGHGEKKYFNGDIYTGYFENGKREGLGSMEILSGSSTNRGIYDGEWEDDKRHGQGIFTWKVSGNTWEGTWNKGSKGVGSKTRSDDEY
jgi:hypothetical protein